MTEKRYSYNVNKMIIEKDGKYFAYTTVEHYKIINELNSLYEENIKLKQQLSEQNNIEWLRNNTTWESIPTNRRTYTEVSKKNKK